MKNFLIGLVLFLGLVFILALWFLDWSEVNIFKAAVTLIIVAVCGGFIDRIISGKWR